MNELFIIAGFLALLANIFYCVFWMSREVWRYLTGKEIEDTEMQEEYLKVLDSDFYDGRRPWSLSIPTENHMIDAAREQIKKHGYTEFGVDFGPLPDCDNTLKVCWPIPGVPDSNGDIYSQDAVDKMKKIINTDCIGSGIDFGFPDSMKMAMQANSKGILDNFQDIDKVWFDESNHIDSELLSKLESRNKSKPILDIEFESKIVKGYKVQIVGIIDFKKGENYFLDPSLKREFEVMEVDKIDVLVKFASNGNTELLNKKQYLNQFFYKKA